MAVTIINKSRDVRRAVRYVKGSKKKPRELASGSYLCDENRAGSQMYKLLKVYDKGDGFVQSYNTKISFDDLKPDDKEHHQIALEYGLEFAQKAFPNNPSYVGVHNDGKGGKLHIHVVTCAVNLDGKSLRGDVKEWKTLAKINDSIAIGKGLKTLDTDEHGLSYIDHYVKRKQMKRDNLTSAENKMKVSNRKNQSFKEILREQIADSLSNTKDLQEFREYMKDTYDIDVVDGKRDLEYKGKSVGKRGSITARKLGDDYKKESIEETLKEKNLEMQKIIDLNKSIYTQEKTESEESFTLDFDVNAELNALMSNRESTHIDTTPQVNVENVNDKIVEKQDTKTDKEQKDETVNYDAEYSEVLKMNEQFDLNMKKEEHLLEAHTEALKINEQFDKQKQIDAEKQLEERRKQAFIMQHSISFKQNKDGTFTITGKSVGEKKYNETPKDVRDKYFEIIQERMKIPVKTISGTKRRRTYKDVLSDAHTLVQQERDQQEELKQSVNYENNVLEH